MDYRLTGFTDRVNRTHILQDCYGIQRWEVVLTDACGFPHISAYVIKLCIQDNFKRKYDFEAYFLMSLFNDFQSAV